MVQTFSANANNDIFIDAKGNLAISTDEFAVMAACATATKAQKGEMIYTTQSGIPNFQTIWTGTPDYGIWKAAILNTLQNVKGVAEVVSLTLSIANNTVSYTAKIRTIYSTQPIVITG